VSNVATGSLGFGAAYIFFKISSERVSGTLIVRDEDNLGWILVQIGLQAGFSDTLCLSIGQCLDVAVPDVNTVIHEKGGLHRVVDDCDFFRHFVSVDGLR